MKSSLKIAFLKIKVWGLEQSSASFTIMPWRSMGEWRQSAHFNNPDDRWSYLRQDAQGTHWTGGCLGLTTDLDDILTRKTDRLCRKSSFYS